MQPRSGQAHGPSAPPRHGDALSGGDAPNGLWGADFKGEFKLGDARYCYPLTVTDHASRLLLLCEALESTRQDPAITVFEQLFRGRGLPLAIRSDNGVPFASPNGLFIWLVSFMGYDLSFIDLEQKTSQPPRQPVGPMLSPMS